MGVCPRHKQLCRYPLAIRKGTLSSFPGFFYYYWLKKRRHETHWRPSPAFFCFRQLYVTRVTFHMSAQRPLRWSFLCFIFCFYNKYGSVGIGRKSSCMYARMHGTKVHRINPIVHKLNYHHVLLVWDVIISNVIIFSF